MAKSYITTTFVRIVKRGNQNKKINYERSKTIGKNTGYN